MMPKTIKREYADIVIIDILISINGNIRIHLHLNDPILEDKRILQDIYKLLRYLITKEPYTDQVQQLMLKFKVEDMTAIFSVAMEYDRRPNKDHPINWDLYIEEEE